MEDLISRQAAIDAIYKCTDIYVNNLPIMIDKAEAYKAISELPSTQPEIIRCKDCKHDHDCNIQYHAQAGEEFYCGAAERRTE